MDDAKIQEGFARLETLIDNLANLCAREFKLIAERFANVDERLTTVDDRLTKIEARIEAFGHRVDDEVEERHALGERLSKLEKAA
jgi:chromosome segregation ATPase